LHRFCLRLRRGRARAARRLTPAIPAGGSTAFNVTVSIPVAASEASLCKVPNTAKITDPAGGAAPNLNAGDDESSATAMTFGPSWEDPVNGITFVMCHPTNLKVEKTAAGDCKKDGEQFACGYVVTVTNMGPDPFKGPIKLDEKFASAPMNITFGGGFHLQWRRRKLQVRNGDRRIVERCEPNADRCREGASLGHLRTWQHRDHDLAADWIEGQW
jgi:hypothetical protein